MQTPYKFLRDNRFRLRRHIHSFISISIYDRSPNVRPDMKGRAAAYAGDQQTGIDVRAERVYRMFK